MWILSARFPFSCLFHLFCHTNGSPQSATRSAIVMLIQETTMTVADPTILIDNIGTLGSHQIFGVAYSKVDSKLYCTQL